MGKGGIFSRDVSAKHAVMTAPEVAPACGNCGYFVAPKPAPPGVKLADIGIAPDVGECIRFPLVVRKRVDRICGEHPRFDEYVQLHPAEIVGG